MRSHRAGALSVRNNAATVPLREAQGFWELMMGPKPALRSQRDKTLNILHSGPALTCNITLAGS